MIPVLQKELCLEQPNMEMRCTTGQPNSAFTIEDEEKTPEKPTEDNQGQVETTVETTPKRKKSRRFVGITLSLATALISPLSAVAVKSLTGYNAITIASWRFIGMLVVTVPLVMYHWKDVRKGGGIKSWRVAFFLLARCITSTSSLLCHYFALSYISVGDFKAIGSSKPFFVIIVAHFTLREKCGVVQPIAGALVILGLTIVAKPPFLLGDTEFDYNRTLGAGLALCVLVFSTASDVFLRRLREVHYTLLSLTYGIFGLLVTFTLELSLFQELVFPRDLRALLIAFALCSVVVLTQNMVNFAFKFETASINSLVRSSTLIFGYIWQFIIFGNVPDKYSLIGSTLVLVAVVMVGTWKIMNEKKKNKVAPL